MKKILYISTRYPFPVKSGRDKMIEQTLRFLSEEFEIYFVFFQRKVGKFDFNLNLLMKYNIRKILPLNFPNVLEVVLNQFVRSRTSLQERLFFSRRNKKKLISFIREVKPNIIIADMLRTAQYIEDLNYKKVLDMDDLLSIRYKRFKLQSLKEAKILGSFQDLLPSFFYNLVERFFKDKILSYESKKIKSREVELARKFNATFLVSPREVRILKECTGLSNIYAFPPSIEIRRNIYNFRIKENNFLFIGNMKTSQNLSSIKLIIDRIFPKLVREIDFKLKIVGTYDNRLVNIIRPYKDHIEILGFVENLEEVIKNSKLLLSPIAFGTGIKTKILDAMSYGLPVITNSIGVEGLNIENNVHCIVEDNLERLSEKIIKLIKKTDKLAFLSRKGYEYVLENHHPKRIKKEFLIKIKEILEEKNKSYNSDSVRYFV